MTKVIFRKAVMVLVMYGKITQPKVFEVQEIKVTLGLVHLQIFSFEYLDIQKKLRQWQ